MTTASQDYPGLTERETKWIIGLTGFAFFFLGGSVLSMLTKRGFLPDTLPMALLGFAVSVGIGMVVGFVLASLSLIVPKWKWYLYYCAFLAATAGYTAWWLS